MLDVAAALVGVEAVEEFADGVPEVVAGAGAAAAQERLQLGEDHLIGLRSGSTAAGT